jgi:mono/diheme cytochrome c family protein
LTEINVILGCHAEHNQCGKHRYDGNIHRAAGPLIRQKEVMTMKAKYALIPFLFAGIASTGIVLADSESDRQKVIEKGAAHYRIFCINCHGPELDGQGPLIHHLKIQPADLTALNKTNAEGQTISERVFNAVAGRHKVGDERKMPLFNDNLEINTAIEIAEFIKAMQK